MIQEGVVADNETNYYDIYLPENKEFEQEFDQIPEEEWQTVEVTKVEISFKSQECYLIIIKDITSILNYEKQKSDSKYQSLLLGTVSHEMLTPLNSIIGLSNLLQLKNKPINESLSQSSK